MMRISNDARELADRRFIQAAQTISAEHYRNIQQHEQTMPRGGAMQGAVDSEHVNMARKVAKAYVDCHLEVFMAEGLIPDANDLKEMRTEINAVVARHEGSEFWTPRPTIAGVLSILPDQIYGQLANRVRQMELESKLPKANVPAAGSINIRGHNFGAIQQGGQNNSQSVTINTQLNAKIHELLSLIDGATDLTPPQKLKASTDLQYLQELTTLEASQENQEEARSRLDDITSILSLSADLVSIGIPTIQIIRALLGL
jgi:hypothetical protein